ncbi:MAG: YIP1 family protein [Chloroflexi bacterium]|nr:YIP1 family protein [Chloroflexota bacterium]
MKQRFRDWIAMARAALALESGPFYSFGSGPAPLQRAVLLVVVVGLMVGGVNAMIQLPALTRTPSFNVEALRQQIDQGLSFNETFRGELPPEVQTFLDVYRSSIEVFAPQIPKIMAVPSPLPAGVGRFLSWLGDWLSTPFGLLGRWLSISIWIMLFARLVGGKGTLLAYLGASSLSVLPHLLQALSFIPVIGGLFAVVAGIWGLAIQVKAVELTHQLPQKRAILAVILPYLLLFVLLAMALVVVLVLLMVTIAGGGS